MFFSAWEEFQLSRRFRNQNGIEMRELIWLENFTSEVPVIRPLVSRWPENLHAESGNDQVHIFPLGIWSTTLGNSETLVRQMGGCHLKDTSCLSAIQTSIYEGKESVLRRRTEKQKQSGESPNHSQMSIACCIPETMLGWSFDENSRPEWELHFSFKRGAGLVELWVEAHTPWLP